VTSLRYVFLALALGLAGCVVSPQPNPPSLDPQTISVEEHPAGFGHRIVVGGPGSVFPPEGAIVALNLDGAAPPAAEPVNADGSFSISIELRAPEQEIRLQVRNGGVRGEPLDFTAAVVGPITPSVRPLADCLHLEPALEIDFGASDDPVVATVEIQNDCDRDLSFLPSRLRSTGPFTVTADVTTIAEGEAAVLRVGAAAPSRGAHEDVLFVETSDPPGDRRPLGLFVRTPD
jgi:hypothetical protein